MLREKLSQVRTQVAGLTRRRALRISRRVVMAQGTVHEGRISHRGFASMKAERQRQIASMGGKAVPDEKRSFSQNRRLAAAGPKDYFPRELGEPRQGAERPHGASKRKARRGDPVNLIQLMLA